MTSARVTEVALSPVVAALLFGVVAFAQQPTFRTTTDVLVVETQVVDSDGRPIAALAPADFEVKVGGRVRTVVSADLVRYTDGVEGLTAERAASAPDSVGRVPKVEEGRLFIIAVDELSFRDNQLLPILKDARAFLTRVQANDQVALFGFPTGRTTVNFTRDHSLIARALGPALGGSALPSGRYNLSASEIIDLSAGDREVLRVVQERECRGDAGPVCPSAIVMEARSIGSELEGRARASLRGLSSLFESLSEVPGRKTVVLLTGGMMSADRVGGRPNITSVATAAGREAAKANATLYVIHNDDHMLDLMSVRRGRGARAPNIRDTAQMAQGLDFLAGAANGHLINVSAGTAEYAFARVLRETSAYYILGVATEERDRNGKEHFIDVKVDRKGVTVRHRRAMVIGK